MKTICLFNSRFFFCNLYTNLIPKITANHNLAKSTVYFGINAFGGIHIDTLALCHFNK